VSPGSEGGEDLELSSSEDEREKEERLAKEALKSFAQSYTKVHIGFVRLPRMAEGVGGGAFDAGTYWMIVLSMSCSA
jgi:hypothetical protein